MMAYRRPPANFEGAVLPSMGNPALSIKNMALIALSDKNKNQRRLDFVA